MPIHRARGIRQLTLLSQCGLVTLGFWVWFLGFRPWLQLAGETAAHYLIYNELLLLGLWVGASFARLNPGDLNPSFDLAGQVALRQTATALFYLFLYLVALRDKAISRLFLFSFIPVLYLVLVASFYYLPACFGRHVFMGLHAERILLVGAPDSIPRARHWCQARRQLGFQPTGILCDNAAPNTLESLPVLGRTNDLDRVLSVHAITQVFVSEFPSQIEILRTYSRVCERHGVRLLVVNDLNTHFGHPVAIFEDQGLFLIGLREEPLENPLNRFLKRCLDLAVSIPAVVVVLPVGMAVVWLCQKRQSPGPLFHTQRRTGILNHEFHILKFRTMHLHHDHEARQASSDDPRIFPAGKWLRKLSLDELPQFLNVLRGEMSVVGPRPHLVEHSHRFARVTERYPVRTLVKPGITGLAQVLGLRGEIKTENDITRRVEADIRYLENWSLWLDCWLILRTASQVAFPPPTAV